LDDAPHRIRVLLIEDSPEDAELILREIRKAGYQPEWDRVFMEVQLLGALEQPWDAIISDFSMPRFDGLRAFEVCQEVHPDTPFIFVSGQLGEERAVAAIRAGAKDYIVKAKLGRLQAALHRELHQNELRRLNRASHRALAIEQRRFRSVAEATVVGLLDVDLSVARLGLEELDMSVEHADREISQLLALAPVSFHNAAARRILPFEKEADAVYSVGELLRFVNPTTARALAASLRRGGETFSERAQLKGSDPDAELHVLLALHVPADPGEFDHVVICVFDITEQVAVERQFLVAQRLDALGRLAAGVAHDFNNLLLVIRQAADRLLSHEVDGEEMAVEIEAIRDAARKATDMTRRLLSFSRGERRTGEVVNVPEVVSSMSAMLVRLGDEGVSIEHVTDGGPLLVACARSVLEQIIMNLSVNAFDAMRGGGHLRIESRLDLVETPRGYAADRARPGYYAVISVSDDGMGIDPATQRQMFEPMFTTKQAEGGSGLGLSTVFGAVRRHRGFIVVESELGLGTTIEVHLPLHEGSDGEP